MSDRPSDATSEQTYETPTASTWITVSGDFVLDSGSFVPTAWEWHWEVVSKPYVPPYFSFDHKENNKRVKMALRPSEKRIARWGRIERGTRPWTTA